jgi:hypothetical protein
MTVMNGNTHILARMRRRKARGAFYAIALFLAAQLSAAITPCFAIGAVARTGAHAPHGDVSAKTSHGGHGSGADHAPHAGYHASTDQTPEPDGGPHCPHCLGGVAVHGGGLEHDGQFEACATVEIVDSVPQSSLEHSLKSPYAMASAVPILFPRPAARASPPRDPPPVPIAVPLNIRHCVFLI